MGGDHRGALKTASLPRRSRHLARLGGIVQGGARGSEHSCSAAGRPGASLGRHGAGAGQHLTTLAWAQPRLEQVRLGQRLGQRLGRRPRWGQQQESAHAGWSGVRPLSSIRTDSRTSTGSGAWQEGSRGEPVQGTYWSPEGQVNGNTVANGVHAADGSNGQELAEANGHLQEELSMGVGTRAGVTIVDTVEQAREVVQRLLAADPNIIHACDTEVMDIDVKAVGPVGNGFVTCVSIYSGPDFDYGEGPGKALWVDNLDEAQGVLDVFKDWFEDERFKKVWHNYGFDRHVLHNMNIDCKGFAGDTMHMARLADSSRDKVVSGGAGYSLESLSTDLLGDRKVPMKEIFGVAKLLKDGTPSKVKELPPIEVLQRGTLDSTHRANFIKYSSYDAESTWRVHEALATDLTNMVWLGSPGSQAFRSMKDFYDRYLVAFGETLTDMERRGIMVNAKDYLASVEVKAKEDKQTCMHQFRSWVESVAGPDGLHINPQSTTQLQTLLFGGAASQKVKGEEVPRERVVKVELTPEETEEYEAFERHLAEAAAASLSSAAAATRAAASATTASLAPGVAAALKETGAGWVTLGNLGLESRSDLEKLTVAKLKELCKICGVKVSGKKAELQARVREALGPEGAEGLGALEGQAATDGQAAAAGVTEEAPFVDPVQDDYSRMSEDDLRDALRARSLRCEGGRGELLQSLREDDAYSYDLLANSANSAPVAATGAPPRTSLMAHSSLPQVTRVQEVAEGGEHAVAAAEASVSATGADAGSTGAEEEARSGEDAEYAARMKEKYGDRITGRPGGKRYREITIRSLGLTPVKYTASGLPSVTMDVLRTLAGKQKMDGSGLDPDNLGSASGHFGGGEAGLDACRAMDALCSMGSIDTMISSFIEPLQKLADDNSRVHCSLNLNTETGRLSARKPNLQNQPALEKDQYKIRDAFTCAPGNRLIVADYGQVP